MKVADCVALFAFGCNDIVPIDTHMRQLAIKHFNYSTDVALNKKTYYQ